ncbi:hypothetical protein SAMN02745148_00888 [Modicisalibacter ilicicola DSM 19980]|uniref:Uncharacterized protein n=1 Tax=Modicisalibacter ilicicola DSM 19980 TaxID=1121942 RepID=A0A1M4V7Q4_9GAMM|nr:hypothetical protein SAMN02745148_00888 [Halomonas ilicicola DSM 19980]
MATGVTRARRLSVVFALKITCPARFDPFAPACFPGPQRRRPGQKDQGVVISKEGQLLRTQGRAGVEKNSGRSFTPSMLPAKAATSHSQPCRLPDAMPPK